MKDGDWNRWAVGLWAIAIAAVFLLSIGYMLPEPPGGYEAAKSLGGLDYWLGRYQAIAAGLLGLAGGVIAFVGVRLQEQAARDRWLTDRRLEMVGLAALIESDLRAWIPEIDEARLAETLDEMELSFPESIMAAVPRLHRLPVPGTTLLQAIGLLHAHNRMIAMVPETIEEAVEFNARSLDGARERLAILHEMSTDALNEIHEITSSEHRFRI
jgi:hypothetical protein